MVIDEYNPLEGKFFQILDQNGKVVNDQYLPDLDDQTLITLFKNMLTARHADAKAFKLQRSGRMGTFAQVKGQEAAQTGSAFALKKTDWMFPAFRESAAYLIRECPLYYFFLYNMGNEEGQHLPEDQNNFTISVPTGSQTLHAVGFAWAAKKKKEDTVTMVYFGDGSSSEGDVHEAMNFAGTFHIPTVFICQNNQYAISTSRKQQSAAETLAQRAFGYGFKGIQVDGNDLLAMYVATKEAIEKARRGEGPTFIEAVTYRMAPHTTSDDPTLYRSKEEEEEWEAKDPIKRMRTYLTEKGIWSEHAEKEHLEWAENFVNEAIKKAEEYPHPDPKDMFKYQFKEMTQELIEQEQYLEESMKYKE